jgi:ActR/RegA family two-component response regulator
MVDPSQTAAAPPGPRLLLVDDDGELLEILARRFRRRGMEVVACQTAAAAVEALARHPTLRVAVVDGRVGASDGAMLVQQLEQVSSRMNFIMLSGSSDAAAIEEARRRGRIREYLCKPCRFDDLEAAVHRALNAPRAP